MARRRKKSSVLIRDVADSLGTGARPADIRRAVQEKYHRTVSYSAISSALKSAKKTRRGSANGNISLAGLLAAKKLVADVGGVEEARAALDALGKLTS
jgi:hypothetical protein